MGKEDDDKVGYLLVIILVTVPNIELGNCEGFSLYLSLSPTLVCALGG